MKKKEIETIQAVIGTLEEIPKMKEIERWGLVYVCWNTLRQMLENVETEAEGEE